MTTETGDDTREMEGITLPSPQERRVHKALKASIILMMLALAITIISMMAYAARTDESVTWPGRWIARTLQQSVRTARTVPHSTARRIRPDHPSPQAAPANIPGGSICVPLARFTRLDGTVDEQRLDTLGFTFGCRVGHQTTKATPVCRRTSDLEFQVLCGILTHVCPPHSDDTFDEACLASPPWPFPRRNTR